MTHFIDAVHNRHHKHGTELAWKVDKCRCSKCTSAHAAWLREQRRLGITANLEDPRVCEHCPGEVRFPTKQAKHEHVRVEHPITRTPVTTDRTLNIFDLPTLDMKGW